MEKCHVSYSKGGFEVSGLPEGIAFKKPGKYGLRQVQQIMEHANNIQFIITDNGQVGSEDTFWQVLNESEKEEYSNILKKLLTMKRFLHAFSRMK